MRIHIGTDHAGFAYAAALTQHLTAQGHEVYHHGAMAYDPLDDFPAYCIRAAEAVARDEAQGIDVTGIVLGGSGNGEQIAANKVEGIRAALIWSIPTAELARQHNNANVAAFGERQHTLSEVIAFTDTFLKTKFSLEERQVRRIGQIRAYEVDGTIVPSAHLAPEPEGRRALTSFEPEAG